MVAQWYVLRLEERRTLPWASRSQVTTRSMSPQHLRSPILTLDVKEMSLKNQVMRIDLSQKSRRPTGSGKRTHSGPEHRRNGASGSDSDNLPSQ